MQVAHEIQSRKGAQKCVYFYVKSFINQRNDMNVCGAAAIFFAIMSNFKWKQKLFQNEKLPVTTLG